MGYDFRIRILVGLLVLTATHGILSASVVVATSISLTQLRITPTAGSIQFVSPLISPPGCSMPSLCATAFTQAQDSLGGLQQQFNLADNGATSATSTTSLASANAAASAPARTNSASDGVNLNVNASASSTAQGTLYGTFQVVGTTSPVMINFSATLSGSQMLSTDAIGLSASSEAIFSLVLDNGDNPVSFDSLQTIGSSAFFPLLSA
jgi:hypothetical protein